MAKKTSRERRASAARASQIKRAKKGTSYNAKYSVQKKKGVGKKKIIIISAISVLVLAAIAFSVWFFVFRNDDTEGMEFAYNAELGGYEVRATDKNITSAEIPEKIDGVPVVAIAKNGFSDCKKLESISIPDSVFYIGAGAFGGCESLKYTEYNNGKYLGNSDNPYLVLITVRNDEELTAFQTEASTKIIYDYAFGELEYMSLVIITDNVKQIGVGAFAQCAQLAEILIYPGTEYIGDYAFYYCKKLSTVTFGGADPKIGAYVFSGCTSLLNVTLPYSMTEIADGMFKDTGIISLTIPDSVKRIGKHAFDGCTAFNMPTLPTNLESIDSYAFNSCFASSGNKQSLILSSTGIKHIGAYAFSGCTGISLVDLPGTLCDLGAGAFSGCSGLVTFNINRGSVITQLPDAVLENCESLVNVTLPSTVSSYGNYAFYNCTALEKFPVTDSLRTIGAGTFGQCTSLKAAVIPDTVTEIGEDAFRAAANLESVTLPSALTDISSRAFYGCKKLTDINIPSTVKSIGSDAFYSCEALASLELPDGLVKIADGAFDECKSLSLTVLPEALTSLGYINENNLFSGYESTDNHYRALGTSFSYTEYEGGQYAGTAENPYMIFVSLKDMSATEITLHADTRIIASGAFYYATKLSSVTLPSGLTTVGDYAFGKCTSLTEITLLSTVSVIMNGAFYGCKNLTDVTLLSALTDLPEYAFYECEKLENVEIAGTLRSVGNSAFYNCAALVSLKVDEQTSGLADAFYGCTDYEYTTDGGVLYLGNAENPYLVLVEAADKTLTSYTVKSGTKFIHSSAFYNCAALVSVTVPESVTQIGSGAFAYCSALASVTLPSGITKIAMGTFAGCTSLASVSAPGVTSIEDGSIYYANSGAFAGCTSLRSVVTGRLEKIGIYAFYGSTALASLELSDALTEIGDYAFAGCTSLGSMRIPKSVLSVGGSVFDGCTSLGTVEIEAEFEHSGFAASWLDQTNVNMTSYIHVKRGA